MLVPGKKNHRIYDARAVEIAGHLWACRLWKSVAEDFDFRESINQGGGGIV
jgi:hypothetical protein